MSSYPSRPYTHNFKLFAVMAMVSLLGSLLSLKAFGADKNQRPFGENSASLSVMADAPDPLTYMARFQPSKVEAGGTTELLIEMTLLEGYHAYLDRFKLTIESPDNLKLAPFKIAPIVSFQDVVTKTEKRGVAGKSTLRALIEVPLGFQPGDYAVKSKLVYQACTKEFCLFPKTKPIEIPLHIFPTAAYAESGPSRPEIKEATQEPARIANLTKEPPQQDFESALSRGTLPAFFFVFVIGFLTSLTPCIYPMIPITLAVLGARAHEHSTLKNFSIALTYVLGLALTYALLGVLAAMTGGLFGAALGNPWVVSAIALIFVAMGFSMLGFYDLQPPAFMRDRLGSLRLASGYSGAFATGLIAGVVASPCVGPVLVGVLTYIANTQNSSLGFFLLFTFAIGMGLPFLALGMSSAMISRLPKSGPWMNTVKNVFGIIMIAMAFYYIKPVSPDWLFHILLGLALVTAASLFGAFEPIKDARKTPRLIKGFMIAVLFTGSWLTAGGVLSQAGFMLPGLSSSSAPDLLAAKPMNWQPYTHALFEEAIQRQSPVLIDFGAEWCEACKEMERTTLVHPKVTELGLAFTLLKVDGTEETPELKEILSRFKVFGFPTYLFFDKNGKPREELSLFGASSADDFARRMSATLE